MTLAVAAQSELAISAGAFGIFPLMSGEYSKASVLSVDAFKQPYRVAEALRLVGRCDGRIIEGWPFELVDEPSGVKTGPRSLSVVRALRHMMTTPA